MQRSSHKYLEVGKGSFHAHGKGKFRFREDIQAIDVIAEFLYFYAAYHR